MIDFAEKDITASQSVKVQVALRLQDGAAKREILRCYKLGAAKYGAQIPGFLRDLAQGSRPEGGTQAALRRRIIDEVIKDRLPQPARS